MTLAELIEIVNQARQLADDTGTDYNEVAVKAVTRNGSVKEITSGRALDFALGHPSFTLK